MDLLRKTYPSVVLRCGGCFAAEGKLWAEPCAELYAEPRADAQTCRRLYRLYGRLIDRSIDRSCGRSCRRLIVRMGVRADDYRAFLVYQCCVLVEL